MIHKTFAQKVTEALGFTPEPFDTTGLATSENQVTLESLIETLQELNQRLSPLAGAMANIGGQALRTQGIGTFAVSGPITSALSIAEKALGGASYTMRTAEENMVAIQSNINNAIMK
jgi:hypothetical protein